MKPSVYMYRVSQFLCQRSPEKVPLWFGQRLADLHFNFSDKDRKIVQKNLSVILKSDIDEDSILVREVFRNFAWYMIEFLEAGLIDKRISIDGAEKVKTVLNNTGPAILLTGHIGNWEVAASSLSRVGIRVSAVALSHNDAKINSFFDQNRERFGVDVIALGPKTVIECLLRLRSERMVGIVGDRDFGLNGISVSFCGKKAYFPRGTSILSLRSGLPVVPVFLIRKNPRNLFFYVEDPIFPPYRESKDMNNSEFEKNIIQSQLTQLYADKIESYVERFPTQWLMFQDVFESSCNQNRVLDKSDVIQVS